MRILIATVEPLSSNTSAAIQNRQIIESLSLSGNEVDVITLDDNKQSSNYDNNISVKELGLKNHYKIPLQKKYLALSEKKMAM